MKRILVACGVAVLSLGTARSIMAATELELVSGTDIILFDGTTLTCTSGGSSVACSSFGAAAVSLAPGEETVAATAFNGWNITQSSGGSNSPNCNGLAGPGCVSTDNINATTSGATSALNAYFGSTGFGSEVGLTLSETSSGLENGTATASGYAYSDPTGTNLGFSSTAAPSFPGGSQIGTTLSLSAPGAATPTGGLAPVAPFDLAIADSFAGNSAASYDVDTTISAVPEPTGVALFGGVVLAVSTALRRRAKKA